nr:N-acetylneuraminate synthase family protein [Aureitalea marina]
MTTIAEIGQAHDGSLGMLHAYIDALAETGVTAVKFQTHIARAESSEFEPFRVKFSSQDASRYDYWQRMEFSREQWVAIGQHCREKGLRFISSPFSNLAVDVLEEAGVDEYKIGSGEVTNHLLLQKLAATGKPVILSSGMSSWEELDAAVNLFRSQGTSLSILQCTTAYPTAAEQYGLNVIKQLAERYELPVGFSDHSGGIAAGIAAAALGAKILEFHVVFDKQMFGPDVTSSLTMDEVKTLVSAVNQVDIALNNPVDKSDTEPYTGLKQIFEKSLAVNKSLDSGHVLTFEDLEAKKPAGRGIAASEFDQIIGRTLKRPLGQWDFINENDLEDS